jgi:hypothetical protein
LEHLDEYKAVNLLSNFPYKLEKKPKEVVGDPNAVRRHTIELLKLCYSSVETNKQ